MSLDKVADEHDGCGRHGHDGNVDRESEALRDITVDTLGRGYERQSSVDAKGCSRQPGLDGGLDFNDCKRTIREFCVSAVVYRATRLTDVAPDWCQILVRGEVDDVIDEADHGEDHAPADEGNSSNVAGPEVRPAGCGEEDDGEGRVDNVEDVAHAAGGGPGPRA